jgi:hypothetical protein
MKTLVLALALLLSAPAFAGTSLTLTPLSPFQVLGVQCGTGTSVATATGFAGAYATTYTVASTRCGGSGRGGGYHVHTYNGCATARYTLTGELRDYAPVACIGADSSLTFTTDTGYSESTVSSLAVLTLPDITPTASFTGPSSVTAPVGELTTFTVSIVNDGSVPLHVYSVSGSGGWLSSVSADCSEVDLAPGDACPFSVSVYPGSAEQSTTTITLAADTSSLTPPSFSQVVDIPEPPDQPPPTPGPTVTVVFAQTPCDSNYVCTFTPVDPSAVVSGVFSLWDFSFTLTNADGTVDVALPTAITLVPEADGVTFDGVGSSAVTDANGNVTKTVDWTTTFYIPDGVTLSLLGGSLTITP